MFISSHSYICPHLQMQRHKVSECDPDALSSHKALLWYCMPVVTVIPAGSVGELTSPSDLMRGERGVKASLAKTHGQSEREQERQTDKERVKLRKSAPLGGCLVL